MKEVLTRRYSRVVREGGQLPDLVLVDGGRGQLNAAVEALEEVGIMGDVDIAGLAKRLEEVVLPNRAESIMLPKTSSSLKLLQQARDEAHRFAITFHKSKRSSRTLQTELTQIAGIGDKKASALLKTFGSVRKVATANLETLQEAAGKKTGKAIYMYFHEQGNQKEATPEQNE